jgi:hypothetical protein
MSNLNPTICVAPLTPTYSTLPRLNTTALLLFIILSPTSSWATKGALAALMVRVATISIHAIVMLAMRDASHALELDIISAWFILSEVAAAAPIMLLWAPSLRGSKARLLVKLWGVLVFIGAICAFTTVQWAKTSLDERTCLESEIIDETLVYAKQALFSDLTSNALLGRFDIAAVAAASFGLLVSIRPDRLRTNQSTSNSMKALFKYVNIAGQVFSSAVLIAIIVLHERYLLGNPKLVMLLPVNSYEQWNCWAAAGLIASATILNWFLGSKMTSNHPKKQAGYTDSWLVATPASQKQHLPVISEKPWRGRRSDLEWAGVVGRPTPSHVN